MLPAPSVGDHIAGEDAENIPFSLLPAIFSERTPMRALLFSDHISQVLCFGNLC